MIIQFRVNFNKLGRILFLNIEVINMVKKSTANYISIGIIVAMFLGSLFTDWDWIFSSKGTTILQFVIIPVFGLLFGIIFILQFLASKDTGEERELQVEKVDAPPEKFTPLKIALLICLLSGALLSVLSTIIYEPGEGVWMSTLGAILAVIGLILVVIQVSTSKK